MRRLSLPRLARGGRLGELEVHDSAQERDCERSSSRKRKLADLVETEEQAQDD